MKRVMFIAAIIFIAVTAYPQQGNIAPSETDQSYFITHTREDLIKKLVELPCGIKPDDQIRTIFDKLENYLVAFVPKPEYTDDLFAREANIQALISLKEGGYGIGSVLVDQGGKIICAAHNSQIQKKRSDLHGEMTLMTKFESSPKSKKYMNLYVYKPGLTVFSSAEPCPMCFIRINSAGADTKYCTPGPEDGMVTRINCLPSSWKEMALKHKSEIGNCSPEMQKIAHLLFYSYLLDNRGPKE